MIPLTLNELHLLEPDATVRAEECWPDPFRTKYRDRSDTGRCCLGWDHRHSRPPNWSLAQSQAIGWPYWRLEEWINVGNLEMNWFSDSLTTNKKIGLGDWWFRWFQLVLTSFQLLRMMRMNSKLLIANEWMNHLTVAFSHEPKVRGGLFWKKFDKLLHELRELQSRISRRFRVFNIRLVVETRRV